jgi:hypothetical protein
LGSTVIAWFSEVQIIPKTQYTKMPQRLAVRKPHKAIINYLPLQLLDEPLPFSEDKHPRKTETPLKNDQQVVMVMGHT